MIVRGFEGVDVTNRAEDDGTEGVGGRRAEVSADFRRSIKTVLNED